MAGQPAGRGGDDTFTFFPTLRDLLLREDPLWDNPFADACQGLSAPGGGVHPSFMEPGHSFAPASMGELSCQGPPDCGYRPPPPPDAPPPLANPGGHLLRLHQGVRGAIHAHIQLRKWHGSPFGGREGATVKI